MSYYPNDFLDQIRYAGDLVALISEDTMLKGHGDQLLGLCPFPEHSEKTPSFSVSSSKQLYHCFGCQNSGNIFTYLKTQRGMSFQESVEYLAKKAGIEIPQTRFVKNSPQPDFYKLTEKICHFYEQKRGQPLVKNYLKKRGWDANIINSFRLGYAPKGNSLLNFLKTPQQRSMARGLGLLNQSSAGESYDNFRDRLIFPIISTRKQVIGFGARVLDNSLPKYINSKESEIFHKSQVFYGLNESARYLRQKSQALLVEGYTDFLALWQAGFKNVVATLGTALTPYHARILKRYVDRVILVFDGDLAGLKASERSLPLLLNEGLKVQFLSLPIEQDPDDFIQTSGQKAFASRIQSAKDLFFYVLKKKQEEVKHQGLDLFALIKEIAPLLNSVKNNNSLKAIYKQRFLDLFGRDALVAQQSLNQQLKNSPKARPLQEKTQQNSPPSPLIALSSALEAERLLLILCLEGEAFLKTFIDKNLISVIKNQGLITIFNKITEQYRQNPKGFDKLIHLIMHKVCDPHLIFRASYPIFNSASEKSQNKIFKDCVDFLTKRQQHNQAGALLAELKMEPKQDIHNLEKIFQLTKQRLEPGDSSKI